MLPSILLAVVALFFMIKWWLETKKTKSLNKEVLAQKNELGLNKDFFGCHLTQYRCVHCIGQS